MNWYLLMNESKYYSPPKLNPFTILRSEASKKVAYLNTKPIRAADLIYEYGIYFFRFLFLHFAYYSHLQLVFCCYCMPLFALLGRNGKQYKLHRMMYDVITHVAYSMQLNRNINYGKCYKWRISFRIVLTVRIKRIMCILQRRQ